MPILIVNLGYIVVFGGLSLARLNYEFVIYTAVIVFFFSLIFAAQRKVEFSQTVLWGLTAWGFLHMIGGHVFVGGKRLYELILLPLLPEYEILKYDQFTHMFGFGVATLAAYHLLRPHLKDRPHGWRTLSALVFLMGMGLGALNEVLEFLVVLVAPARGVGGYLNTALDLSFNMLGAVLAVGWLSLRRMRGNGELPTV